VSAAAKWAAALAALAIPPEILAQAPEDPWAFPVSLFVRAAEAAVTVESPSVIRARAALSPGGSVLDVGCGAGAASLPLCPPAGSIVGVDESADMLVAFAEQADARGVDHREVCRRWPAAANDVAAADVVVCSHVLYNVADLAPFVAGLADHSRRRTVVELTSEHPRAWMRPLWRAMHHIDRPTGPVADDAVAVLADLGITPNVERWVRPTPMKDEPIAELAAFVRVALCVTSERDPEIVAALRKDPPPAEREITTLWWDPA